jgi:hypothetical protein
MSSSLKTNFEELKPFDGDGISRAEVGILHQSRTLLLFGSADWS